MSSNKFRVIPMTIAESGDGIDSAVAHVRHAYPDDEIHFYAVQEKEAGRWYTVDDFQSVEEAEEFLRQLIESEEE